MRLEDILIELNKVIPNCELRNIGANPYVDKSYICGYNGTYDISIRVTQYQRGHDKFLYEIEQRGTNILAKYGTYDSYETYIYILKDIIDFSILMSRRCFKFPDLLIEDNRNIILNKLV